VSKTGVTVTSPDHAFAVVARQCDVQNSSLTRSNWLATVVSVGVSRRATRLGIYLDVRRLEDLPSGTKGRESHNLNNGFAGEIVRLPQPPLLPDFPVKKAHFSGAGTLEAETAQSKYADESRLC